ncbi:MAG: diaminopimelate epimerase [Crocinitomicaceae bacterium]
MIKFQKYHGAGNDFIMIDNRSSQFEGDKIAFARKWCERRFGIGSDGVIFIENWADGDFEMDFYNPDGSQSFCGNGSRCAVAFAKSLGIIETKAYFKAVDGNHLAEIEDDQFAIRMGDVASYDFTGFDYIFDTGSPHFIRYVGSVKEQDINEIGRSIRYSDEHKEKGINVNLVEVTDKNAISIRTYERGVEAETLACGTGATAAALSYGVKNNLDSGKIAVKAIGGNLSVTFERFDDGLKNIWLIGPAVKVFEGEINE